MASSESPKYPCPSTVSVANFVSLRLSLNKGNLERSIKDYRIWKEQMVCLLKSQELMGFIDGQIQLPEESMEEQKLWRRTDALIKGWILGSITGTDVLDAVVGLETSREVWLEMENIFKSDTNVQIQNEEDGKTMHNQYESSAINAVDQGNTPAGKDLNRYLPFYRAALKGDWKEGKKFLDKDKEAIAAIINCSSQTALHVAVETGKSNYFVKKLLEYPMPDEALLTQSGVGTALHIAAVVGNRETARMLVNKNPDLLYITNKRDKLPVHLAALVGHKDTLVYLISISKRDVGNSPFVGKSGVLLLAYAISSEFIDVALYLEQKHPDLATFTHVHHEYYPLEVIAATKSVFPSGKSFNWWQDWIYSRVPLPLSRMTKITIDIENPSPDDQVKKKYDWFQKIIFEVPGLKSIKNKKIMHQQAFELVKCLCRALESLPSNDASPIYRSAIINAACKGIHEVVELITEVFPSAIYTEERETECTIFQVAARERIENVFNLIYHMNIEKQHFYEKTDSLANNLLHMCGEIAPPHKLNLVSGAALQMQRELQWFKEIEKLVDPSSRTWENDEDKTPQMLFTEKHRELKLEGEKWMKDTATSCTIAAALITTVVFAAAFTVPGGVRSDSGAPILVNEISFIIFFISNSVSMFTSTTSLLLFLSILTSRYAEEDFLYVLPKRLCIGLLALFSSITFMMVAFSATVYITLRGKSSLFLIPVAAFACLPVASFVLLQFPLLITVMYSTYGPGIFGKKSDRTLY